MTKQIQMADRFDASAVEQALYKHWEEQGYFKPTENLNVPSYCIAIAAKCDGFIAYGTRFPTNLNGYADPLSPYGGA